MSPEAQLILGCFLLSSVVGYAVWTRVRISLFQEDILKIIREVDRGHQPEEAPDHLFRPLFVQMGLLLVQHADTLSFRTLYRFKSLSEITPETSEDSSAREAIFKNLDPGGWPSDFIPALYSIFIRTMFFLYFETATGWLLFLRELLTGQGQATQKWFVKAVRLLPTSSELAGIDALFSSQTRRV